MNNAIHSETDQVNRCGCKLCKENFDFQENLGKFCSTITGTVFDTNMGDVSNLPPCRIDCYLPHYLLQM